MSVKPAGSLGWLQSIRFRLSLGLALVVFAAGAFLVGGIYLWQVRQLDEPDLVAKPLVLRDSITGREFVTEIDVLFENDIQIYAAERIELDAYRQALAELRRAAFAGLIILFLISFVTGWLLSGWVLKPIDQMNRVAREITATDLTRRIGLRGPVDELKGLADTFDAMLDRLQNAFEDQRRFVHETSHELRNPLAVARTNLEVALDGGSEAELRHSVEIAHRSTIRMSDLVEDLLEQARRGVPELALATVDLRQLVETTCHEFDASAAERSLRIVPLNTVSPSTVSLNPVSLEPLLVNGDEPALRRALSNLLANAVRLAPLGSTIEVRCGEQGGWAELSVTDDGPGIDPANHESVFERFWRGSDSGSGSGLGLSIVRGVAERHGGSAMVRSQLGAGSTFTVRLPLRVRADDRTPDAVA